MKSNWKTLNLVFFSNIKKSEKDEPALAALNWRRWTSRWQDRKTRRKALTWETRQSELKWWALACRIIQTSVVNERKHGKNLAPLQQQQPDVDVSWEHSSCYPCVFFWYFYIWFSELHSFYSDFVSTCGKVVLVKLTWKYLTYYDDYEARCQFTLMLKFIEERVNFTCTLGTHAKREWNGNKNKLKRCLKNLELWRSITMINNPNKQWKVFNYSPLRFR